MRHHSNVKFGPGGRLPYDCQQSWFACLVSSRSEVERGFALRVIVLPCRCGDQRACRLAGAAPHCAADVVSRISSPAR